MSINHRHHLLPTASRNITAFAIAVGVFRENKGRSWSRAAHIATLRYILGNARNALDLKFGFQMTTADMYGVWARKCGADVLTDDLPEGAALHWIGPRRKDRVILFLHGACFTALFNLLGEFMLIGSGGGFVLPARADYFNLLESLRKEYNGAVGVAMLNYCTSPAMSQVNHSC